jgi:uncharacterized membrane protein
MKALLAIPLIALLAFSGCLSQENDTGLASASQPPNDVVSIPAASIGSEAKFFEYNASGTTIRFFAVKASDGSIKTAFDACDVCNYAKKGYRQQGTNMVCNNCGNKYPIDGLGTENKNPGGCWPSYLPSSVSGDQVLIQKADLEKGKAMFS